MLSYLSSALLVLLSGVSFASAQEQLGCSARYLAPHEQRLFDALDNVHKDYRSFTKVFAKNAYCELTFGKDPDDITIKSGPCRDVFNNYGNMAQYKIKWHPLTNSDPNHPEKGVLALMYGNYGLSNTGCEGLFFGTSEVKFNVAGKVTDLRSHSTERLDFMNCIDGNKERRIVQEKVYLAPHEQDVYDAMENMHKDFDTFMEVFADNAQCDTIAGQAPADITVRTGPCKEVWRNFEGNVIHNKIKWTPVTNTHANRPEKGVLAVTFANYALAENGCEDLYAGTGTITFNKDGAITRMKSYSNGLMDFMDCINNVSVKSKN